MGEPATWRTLLGYLALRWHRTQQCRQFVLEVTVLGWPVLVIIVYQISFLFELGWVVSDLFKWCIDQLWDSLLSVLELVLADRVRSYLSHLSYSGCWCWRLLSSFPGHGAEPAWWQHRLITVRRFTERDVHHSRLHCFYYGQTNPEHRQTGERVW